uniref:U2A'/phosphoprotein 32 family A C-terminal domain-containing protein n=2 Tax=Physcomitrium patens TaxID=3218 RepID=A0A2K1JIY3_PHYPA|nr:hypothetical protein PHYPA_018917 [Physcomitrium patens]
MFLQEKPYCSSDELFEVVCPITKLDLRNNALVSTQGIEALRSLETLDLPHNLISNLHEVDSWLPACTSGVVVEWQPYLCQLTLSSIGNSSSGSWSQRRRRGKEDARRRLENSAIPTDLREAEHGLESIARSGIEDKPLFIKSGMSSWQAREDNNDELPASPPHYDSAVMHRRQRFVNETLRLPLDSSATSSDSDSDLHNDRQQDPVSDGTNSDPNSPSSMTDKRNNFQKLKSQSYENPLSGIKFIEVSDEGAKTSSLLYSGKSERRVRGTLNLAQEPGSTEPSPLKDGVKTACGDACRRRKQKKTRRTMALDSEKLVGLRI